MLSEGKKTRLIRLRPPLLVLMFDVVGKVFPGLTGSVAPILSPSILCSLSHPSNSLPLPPSIKGKTPFKHISYQICPWSMSFHLIPTYYYILGSFCICVSSSVLSCGMTRSERRSLDVVCAWRECARPRSAVSLSQSSMGCTTKALSRVMAQRCLWLL